MTIVLTGTGVSQDLSIIRSAAVPNAEFRAAVHRLGLHLAVETSKYLPATVVEVQTPLEETNCLVIDGDVILLPVLRAGLGLLAPFQEILPDASVGFEGLKRNEETLVPEQYYQKIPPSSDKTTFIVIDPMLATGGSLHATLSHLESLPHAQIMAACVIASPEGIREIETHHPSCTLVVAAKDRELNAQGYIVPGLGDAGDRLFGT